MVLFVWPELSVPTETTPKSSAAISRPTMPCRRTTIIAARYVGSIELCGAEACAEMPWRVTVIVSQAAITGPGAEYTVPEGPG